MALALKTAEINGASYAVLQDGKPVYVDETDGKELGFDLSQLHSKISELNAEAKRHRLTAQELKENLDKFGNATPDDLTALRTTIDELGGPDGIAKLKQKGTVDVEVIKKSIADAYDTKIKSISDAYEQKLIDSNTAITNLTARERQLLIGNGFATSKFLNEKTILPSDVSEAYFGKHFAIEEGKVVAYLGENKIYSRERPGEPASMDEALEAIVDQYPMKDRILKASGQSGSGSQQSNSKSSGGAKTITRAEFERLPPSQQSAIALARTTEIVD